MPPTCRLHLAVRYIRLQKVKSSVQRLFQRVVFRLSTMSMALGAPHPMVTTPRPVQPFSRFPSRKIRHTFPVPDGWKEGKPSIGRASHRPVYQLKPLFLRDEEQEEENTQEANVRAGDGLAIQWLRKRNPRRPDSSGASLQIAPKKPFTPRRGTFQSPRHDPVGGIGFTQRPQTHDGQMRAPDTSSACGPSWGQHATSSCDPQLSTSSCRHAYARHTQTSQLRVSLHALVCATNLADLTSLVHLPPPLMPIHTEGSHRPMTTDGTVPARTPRTPRSLHKLAPAVE